MVAGAPPAVLFCVWVVGVPSKKAQVASGQNGFLRVLMQTLIAYVEKTTPGVLTASLPWRAAGHQHMIPYCLPHRNERFARMTIVAHTDERGRARLEASLEKLGRRPAPRQNMSERSSLERDFSSTESRRRSSSPPASYGTHQSFPRPRSRRSSPEIPI